MKQKITLVLFWVVVIGLSVGGAHEFWLYPSQFFPVQGKTVSVSVNVGEDYVGERWGGGARRVQRLRLFFQNDSQDLTASVEQNNQSVQLKPLTLSKEGTHLLALETNSSFIELEPQKFLEYLKEDGLDNAVAYREKNGEQKKKGRELYRRCAKTLLQVGKTQTNEVTKSTGMVLEILPLQNPYSFIKGSPLTCQFLYEGKPLKNAMVRCWRRVNGKTELEIKRADANGKATFDLTKKGNAAYMISTVTMVRLTNNPKADWQSTWGSLTFGMK